RSPTRTKRSKPSAGNRGPQLDPQPTSVPQNGPDRLPALVAARLKPAPDAPRQPDEESRTRGPLRRRPQCTVTIRMDDAATHAVPLPGSSGEKHLCRSEGFARLKSAVRLLWKRSHGEGNRSRSLR